MIPKFRASKQEKQVEGKMMTTGQTYFYVFIQNNSGGYFVTDENIASEIVIEATDENQAAKRLIEIVDQKPEYTEFCPCCGERWYPEFNDGVYTHYLVSDGHLEEFEKERDGHEAVFYPLGGEHRRIPWVRYGMYKYLPCQEFDLEDKNMTPNEFLDMTVKDVLNMLTDSYGDSLEAKITKDDGSGILVKISCETVEVENE